MRQSNRALPPFRLRCLFGIVLLALPGCSKEAERERLIAEGQQEEWPRVSPAEIGADGTRLTGMIRDIESGKYVNIHSVLITKNDQLVIEEYFDGHDEGELHEIRSATKVIGSILTGIAIDKGFIRSEKDPIHEYLEDDYKPSYGWDPRSRQVEIRHLLSMMSGYDCDDLGTDFACEHAMYATDDWVQYALDLRFAHDPGEHWAYNSSSLILVGEAIAKGSGLPLSEFAERYLLGPLGIRDFSWSVSPRGRAWLGGGARMTSREMAKLGLLMLNRGMWKGERIVSEEWIDKSTTRQGSMHGGVDYGYAWQRGEAILGTRFVQAYWASGNGGQYIIVLPEDGIVVVFTGGNYDDPLADQPFRILVKDILPAFLEHEPPSTIELDPEELHRLTGVYELDFEPNATSEVTVHDGHLRVITPDRESIELLAHSKLNFSADSRYGPVAFLFQSNDRGEIVGFRVYASFSRFTFERRGSH